MVRRVPVLVLIFLVTIPLVSASGIVYWSSDPGDLSLYEALSEKMNIELNDNISTGDIILALDINYNFLNDTGRETLGTLLYEAKSGKTVIIGFNTLRSIIIQDPDVLTVLKMNVTFSKRGILEIRPEGPFHFKPFGYDSDVYGIALVNATGSKIMLKSANGLPVVIEIPVGRGRLIIVTINLSEYYLDSENPAVVEFLVSLINIVSPKGTNPLAVAVGVIGAIGVLAYAATSNNPRFRKVQDLLIKFLVIVGYALFLKSDILRNETRREIYEFIKSRGYATINDIVSTLSVSRTNARWHLTVLKRANLIEEVVLGKTHVFYPAGPYNRERAIKEFILESEVRRKIYSLLMKGMSLTEISKVLNISKSTVHHHISILRKYGLVGEDNEEV